MQMRSKASYDTVTDGLMQDLATVNETLMQSPTKAKGDGKDGAFNFRIEYDLSKNPNISFTYPICHFLSTSDSCPFPRGSKYPIVEVSCFQTSYHLWLLGPESFHIGYFDPKGQNSYNVWFLGPEP